MKKHILSLLLCVIALSQIFAQSKSQVLDDIENTVRDFCAEINVLAEDPQTLQSNIDHISRNFASDDYFMFNGERQASFAKWLARYADVISRQNGVDHEFSLKETTLEKVDSKSDVDRRWYIKSELRRTASNGNSLVEDVAFIVQWNGHERYVTILEMDGKWLRPVVRQTYSTNIVDISSYLWIAAAILAFAGVCIAWVMFKKRKSESVISASELNDKIAELYNTGCKYYDGTGVEMNKQIAVEYFTQAAEQGHANAQYCLAICYKIGEGVKKNFQKAIYWYTKAAEQGHANAQFHLAVSYDFGEGVAKDAKKAVYWYTKAAEQGNANAQFNLGYSYKEGQGIEKDYEKAAYWLAKAAEQGHANAFFSIGLSYYNGEGVEKDVEKAVYWYTKAAEQGHAQAQFNLGFSYDNGEGVEKNVEKAVYWYTKAAEQGNANAQFWLAICYDFGKGVDIDYNKAVYWYTKAAEQGNANAQFNLGYLYKKGLGIEKDYEKAVYWYTKAAEQGHEGAEKVLSLK